MVTQFDVKGGRTVTTSTTSTVKYIFCCQKQQGSRITDQLYQTGFQALLNHRSFRHELQKVSNLTWSMLVRKRGAVVNGHYYAMLFDEFMTRAFTDLVHG